MNLKKFFSSYGLKYKAEKEKEAYTIAEYKLSGFALTPEEYVEKKDKALKKILVGLNFLSVEDTKILARSLTITDREAKLFKLNEDILKMRVMETGWGQNHRISFYVKNERAGDIFRETFFYESAKHIKLIEELYPEYKIKKMFNETSAKREISEKMKMELTRLIDALNESKGRKNMERGLNQEFDQLMRGKKNCLG